jgi:transposase
MATRKVHGYRSRMVRDLPLLGRPVWLEVERRRLKCRRCGVFTERLTWLEDRARTTRRLQVFVADLCRKMTIKDVAQALDLDWDLVKEIDKRSLGAQVSGIPLEEVKLLAIDEFALHKGHRYATVVIDVEQGHVLWVGPGRKREDIRPFFTMLGPERCSRIEAVAMDCTATYGLELALHCPQARIVYDLFHIVARYGREVIDRVRVDQANALRHDRRARKVIKGARWILLRNRENLSTQEDRVRLDELLRINRALAKVYILKDDLKQLWRFRDRAEAEAFWKGWQARAIRSRIPALVRFARNLRFWKEGILDHCLYPIHTSMIEGVNNKIKVIKRMAYGFRDQTYFFLKILAAFYHPQTG